MILLTRTQQVAFLLLWVIIIVYASYLYAYPKKDSLQRKIQGVVTQLSDSQLTLYVENARYFSYPGNPEIKKYQFNLHRNTDFFLERYIVVDDVIVSSTILPKMNINDVHVGDPVYIYFNETTGFVDTVFVGDVVLWY